MEAAIVVYELNSCFYNCRVQQVHEKWVNIRTLLQTKLINILNIHTNPDFKFLAECTEWVAQKLVSVSEGPTNPPCCSVVSVYDHWAEVSAALRRGLLTPASEAANTTVVRIEAEGHATVITLGGSDTNAGFRFLQDCMDWVTRNLVSLTAWVVVFSRPACLPTLLIQPTLLPSNPHNHYPTHTPTVQPTQPISNPHSYRPTHTTSIQPTLLPSNPHNHYPTHTFTVQPTQPLSNPHNHYSYHTDTIQPTVYTWSGLLWSLRLHTNSGELFTAQCSPCSDALFLHA